jgi:hypothetical protein
VKDTIGLFLLIGPISLLIGQNQSQIGFGRVVLQLGWVIEEIFPADNEIILRRIPIGG